MQHGLKHQSGLVCFGYDGTPFKPQIREGSESGKQASLQLRQRRDFAVLRHEGKEVTDGNKFPILNNQGPHFCMRELEAFSH